MSYFVLAQIIGFLAVIFSLTIFQSNKRSGMLKLSALSCLLFVLHFLLIGAYTGAAMKFIAAFRGYAYLKWIPSKHHRWVLYIFSLVTMTATLFTWEGAISLLAMGGSLSAGYAFWHKDAAHIRKWAWLPVPFWAAYYIAVLSYAGLILEIVLVVSMIAGGYRFDRKYRLHHDRHRLARTS